MEYNIRKTGEMVVDFFDDAHIDTVVHRFFMSDSPYDERPLVNSIEFIRDGHVFLSRGGKQILLEAPMLFWMRRGELFRYIFPKEKKKRCEHLFCDFSGEKADRMLSWLEEVCPEGYLQPSDPEKISSIFIEAVNYYRMDPSVYHAEIVECIDRIMLEISRTLRNGPKHRKTLTTSGKSAIKYEEIHFKYSISAGWQLKMKSRCIISACSSGKSTGFLLWNLSGSRR